MSLTYTHARAPSCTRHTHTHGDLLRLEASTLATFLSRRIVIAVQFLTVTGYDNEESPFAGKYLETEEPCKPITSNASFFKGGKDPS